MDHGLAHAGTDIDTADGHGWCSFACSLLRHATAWPWHPRVGLKMNSWMLGSGPSVTSFSATPRNPGRRNVLVVAGQECGRRAAAGSSAAILPAHTSPWRRDGRPQIGRAPV